MQVGLGLYIVVGLSSILLSELMQLANRRAEDSANQLNKKQMDLELEIQRRCSVEEERSTLLRRFVNLQEEERLHISQELHDQCGQEIIALQLSMKRAVNIIAIENQMEVNACFREVNEILDRLSREIHDLAFDLRPPSLDELGLNTAIESFLELWSQRVRISVDFECRNWEEHRLPSEASLVLYRVLQESLSNVAKHSGSRHVSIVLELQRDSAVEIVEDQGSGFEFNTSTEHSMVRRPLGLLGMKERLASVGGSLEIESAIGKGTTLFARVPILPSKK
jgi:signal transduction histidine kinase